MLLARFIARLITNRCISCIDFKIRHSSFVKLTAEHLSPLATCGVFLSVTSHFTRNYRLYTKSSGWSLGILNPIPSSNTVSSSEPSGTFMSKFCISVAENRKYSILAKVSPRHCRRPDPNAKKPSFGAQNLPSSERNLLGLNSWGDSQNFVSWWT